MGMAVAVTIDQEGGVALPEAVLRELNWVVGDWLVIHATDCGLYVTKHSTEPTDGGEAEVG